MKICINKTIKYLLLCVFFFICLVFIFTINRIDTFVNYGFSYAISLGEIPYKDFNLVISPFAPILYSIGLLFCKNIVIYYLEQAILLTILYCFMEKLLGKKSLLFLLVLLIPYPLFIVSVIYPGYNYLIVMLFFIFIYCFKNKKNDYILGLLLGLIFCTKQTVGIVLFIPTLYYLFKDRKKFIKIFIGYLIPIFLLFMYLLITGSFYNFIDLCFLGLFDFNSNNKSISIFYLIVFIIGIIYLIYRIIKDKNNILLYYILLFGIVVFPMIDSYHVSLFLIVVLYLLIDSIKIEDKYYKYIIIGIISICSLWSIVTYKFFNPPEITNYNHFYLAINSKEYNDNVKEVVNYSKKADKKIIYFMRGSENYYYKIINDKRIDYFDLPNYGNYGYKGIDKMKKRIDKQHDVYFMIDNSLLTNNDYYQQYIIELGEYVISKSTKVKSVGWYDVYYKK